MSVTLCFIIEGPMLKTDFGMLSSHIPLHLGIGCVVAHLILLINCQFLRIKIAGRNINNLRYADDTTFMAESKEELDESERGE